MKQAPATAPMPATALGYDPTDAADVNKALARARELRATVARHDPNTFCRYVLRDEQTGRPIVQAPMHREWQGLLSAHDRLLIWSHVEGGKTSQIAIGRSLYELGLDPTLRVCVVSNTSDLAKKMTRQIGQYIEKSPELHEVFPHLLPTDDPNLPWRAQALTVRRPGMGSKDPSVQATGVHGNVIGSRIDLLVLDDILDFENTNTPGPREDAYRWVKNIMGRLTERARVWCVGNAWHPDDPMHRLEKEEQFHAVRFPVMHPVTAALTWPERWSPERVERARRDLGPLEYARQLLCQARDDTSARFKREWIDRCIAAGAGIGCVRSVGELLGWEGPEAWEGEDAATRAAAVETVWGLGGGAAPIVTGVDLAVQARDGAHETVLFTLLVDPDKGVRRVLSIEAGRWSGPETLERLRSVHARFGSLCVVENNAAQDFLVQFTRDQTAIPIVPFTTGRNKAHPEFGVESIAAELAGGKWVIPSRGGVLDKEVAEWVRELLFYDPRGHTGDRVMASWFAREGARRFTAGGAGRGGGTVGARVFLAPPCPPPRLPPLPSPAAPPAPSSPYPPPHQHTPPGGTGLPPAPAARTRRGAGAAAAQPSRRPRRVGRVPCVPPPTTPCDPPTTLSPSPLACRGGAGVGWAPQPCLATYAAFMPWSRRTSARGRCMAPPTQHPRRRRRCRSSA